MTPDNHDAPARSEWRPLAGIRVADFSALFPGPFATTVLADLGADVVKIEPPSGDAARTMLPELFAACSRNKRSVVLDLKQPQSREQARRIAAWADVAIEGFRPGVADRIGIGFQQLCEANPRLVYCSLSGYGQDGPWKDRPGHDLNYLAAGGFLAYPAMAGRPPGRSSVPAADVAGGALAALAIIAALRERDATGRGARLDLSVFESALYCSALRHGTGEAAQQDPFPGNDIFETADGRMVTLALVEDHFWQAFIDRVQDLEPGLRDARFATLGGRCRHAGELNPVLRRTMQSRTVHEWSVIFAGSDVPFELCVTPAQAVRSGHVAARDRVDEIDGVAFVPFPVTVNAAQRPAVHAAAPALGEHTRSFFEAIEERG
jgi:crotonobetainyl-CoA:carnitine CoA-transferase CaiB-like acyl-CoA transferase